jgi:hypothetical protein
MNKAQYQKYKSCGKYTVASVIIALLFTKRRTGTKQMIIPAFVGVDFNYNDILPAIEYLQTACTYEESQTIRDTVSDKLAVMAYEAGQ